LALRSLGVSLVAAALTALLIAAHAAALVNALERPLDHDEGEFLHASWLMSEGVVLYRDFMEDHPPFAFQMLQWLQPRTPTAAYPLLDVVRWTKTARVAVGLFGVVALIALGCVASVVSRSALALVIAVALSVQDPRIWYRGLADIRADPPAMACFWVGALLIIAAFRPDPRRRDAVFSGVGIALLFAAALLNPKWPLQSLTLGVVFLITLWRLWAIRRIDAAIALLPTIAVAVTALVAITSVTTFRDYFYFTFKLKMAIRDYVVTADLYEIRGKRNIWNTLPSRGLIVAAIAAIVLLGSRRWQLSLDRPRFAILTIVLFAALAERLLYFPYSLMWPQYSIGTGAATAVMTGVLAAIALSACSAALLRRRTSFQDTVLASVAIAIAIVAQWQLIYAAGQRRDEWLPWIATGCLALLVWAPAVLAMLHASGRYRLPYADVQIPAWSVGVAVVALACVHIPNSFEQPEKHWRKSWDVRAGIQSNLRPADRVWLGPNLHPIAARDSSYYWYAFGDVMAGALHHGRTTPNPRVPVLTERDFPPCRIAAGDDTQTRFLELGIWMSDYPELRRCVVALVDAGALRTTPYRSLFEVKRPSAAPARWAEDVIPEQLGLKSLRAKAAGALHP
jgi:hypothetical protein